MEQNMKKGKVKGTVLFTVVAVMMVLVVFLISTLILTTSAQRRTYYTYFETQAQYAANAALETVQNSVYSDEGFFNWMANTAKDVGQTTTFDVNFEDTTIPISQIKNVAGKDVRFVTCEIERLDDDWYWDEKNVRIVSRRTWQISATAVVGSGSQAAECVQAFVVYEPVRERLANPDNAGVSWEGVVEDDSGNKGAGVFASVFNSGNDNVSVLGPVYSIGTAPVGRIVYDSYGVTNIANDGVYVGRVVFTESMQLNATKYVSFEDAFNGLEVYGNFNVNNYLFVESEQSPKATKYNELNYVYVDGMLNVVGGAMSVGGVSKQETITPAADDQRVNLYAGALKATKALTVNGDVFLHETELSSSFSDTGLTYLAAFVEQNVQKANYNHEGYAGGDLICANAEFIVDGNRGPTVGGDFLMTNPNGKLIAKGNGDITVNGAVVCAGELHLNSDKSMTAKGGIYVDPTKVKITGRYTINGVQFTPDDDTADEITTKLVQACKNATGAQASYDLNADGNVTAADLHLNNATSAVIESLGAMSFIYKEGTTENEQYVSLVNAMLNCEQTYTDEKGVEKKVKVGLYPFCSRQDEIFKTYIRWDLQKDTEAAARAFLNTDALIKESKAAGHTWDVKEKRTYLADGTCKSIYVPYTTTLNSKDHAFIGEIETGDAAMSAYASIPDADSELPNGMPTLVFDKPGTLLSSYTYYYHKTDGSAANGTISNVMYVDTSCVLDFSQNSNDWNNNLANNGTIFVDPGANGYSKEKPLVIVLKGSFNNGRLNIVVNNTYDYAKGQYYADLGTYTDRDQVVIYWDDTFWAQKANFHTTGSYQAVTSDKSLYYVANPYYPGTTEWGNLTGGEKYKFEYIPNTTIYMDSARTYAYELQNNSFISAFVVSPNCSINMPAAGDLNVKTYYRENHDSIEINAAQRECADYLIAIGGFVVDDFLTNNASYFVYATDGNRPGVYSGTVTPGSADDTDGDFLVQDYKTPA